MSSGLLDPQALPTSFGFDAAEYKRLQVAAHPANILPSNTDSFCPPNDNDESDDDHNHDLSVWMKVGRQWGYSLQKETA